MDSYNSLEEYKNNKKYTCIKCGTLIKNISDGCPKCNFKITLTKQEFIYFKLTLLLIILYIKSRSAAML